MHLDALGDRIGEFAAELGTVGKNVTEIKIHQDYMKTAVESIKTTVADHSVKLDSAALKQANVKGVLATWKLLVLIVAWAVGTLAMPFVIEAYKSRNAQPPIDITALAKALKDAK